MLNVAHVCPHVGGGVGEVLSSFCELSDQNAFTHHLYCLDFCKSKFAELRNIETKEDGMFINGGNRFAAVDLSKFDVILIHYWNHPLLAKLLLTFDFPYENTIIWAHNSGLFEPNIIPFFLTQISKKILFSSACSYSAPNLQKAISNDPHRFNAIHSTRSLDQFFKNVIEGPSISKKVNLLYVGTVSSAKHHPQAAEIYSRLAMLGFKIKVIGGPDERLLQRTVQNLGGDIEVSGEIEDVFEAFQNADIFIYPLRADHYGTGEQVVLEAMAAGLPVVAFDNPAERVILGDVVPLATSVGGFIGRVNELARSKKQYLQAALAARSKVKNMFDVRNMVAALETEFFTSRLDAVTTRNTYPKKKWFTGLEIFVLTSFFNGNAIVDRMRRNSNECTVILREEILKRVSDNQLDRWIGNGKGRLQSYIGVVDSNTIKQLTSELLEKNFFE